MKYDIYITGVGGQGVLTIADILTTAAFKKGLPVNYYPTKGMAQRGGFVKAQLRFGETGVGPRHPGRRRGFAHRDGALRIAQGRALFEGGRRLLFV